MTPAPYKKRLFVTNTGAHKNFFENALSFADSCNVIEMLVLMYTLFKSKFQKSSVLLVLLVTMIAIRVDGIDSRAALPTRSWEFSIAEDNERRIIPTKYNTSVPSLPTTYWS